MKKLLLLMALCLPMLVNAQDVVENVVCEETSAAETSKSRKVYIELLGHSQLFSSKVKITVDFGQRQKLFKQFKLQDENNKDIKFESMVDALNYMGERGWCLVTTYEIGDAKSGYVYHWLLSKDIYNDSELLEGLNVSSYDK